MEFTEHDVEKLAGLARIELTEQQKRTFSKQIASILDYVRQVQEVDTSGARTSEGNYRKIESLRTDAVSQTKEQEEIVRQFPDRLGNLNKVRRVFD
ncbi:MAG: Asp-tRNA(Asn)/Glu-tRNA(Gln) amidotransferase subunit GatC [Patescibacteria group bacterium]